MAIEPLDVGYTAWKIIDWSNECGPSEQHVFKFGNGYGASVIRSSGDGIRGSYGYPDLFELAPARFTDDGTDWNRVHLPDLSGPNESVIGWLSVPDVAETLRKIAALPKPERKD